MSLTCLDEPQPVIKFLANTPEEAIFNGLHTFLFDQTTTRRSVTLVSLYGKASVTRSIDGAFITVVIFTSSFADVMKKSLDVPAVGVVYLALDAELWLQKTVDALFCTRHQANISKMFVKWEAAQQRFQKDEEVENTDALMNQSKEVLDIAEHLLCGVSASAPNCVSSLPSLPRVPAEVQNVLYT